MKKILFILCITFSLMGMAFASGGADTEKVVALVTDTGGIDDKSFNQGTWEGIQKFVGENNLNESAYTYIQSSSDADYIPNLSTVSDEGYKLVIAPGFLFVDSVAEVSQNYPDTHYLVIDTVVEDRDNVASAIFAEEQGSYLVGVAAGLKAKKLGIEKVAFIGGIDFDVIQHFEAGFEAGVVAVAPNVEVLVEYAGSFSDPQRGQTVAAKLYDQGAGIIFVAAGSTGNGVIKEAKDRSLQGDQAWVIGVDRDQYLDGIYQGNKSVILTSMVKNAGTAAYLTLKDEMEGNFKSGIITFDLSNGGVGIPDENPNLDNNEIATIRKYEEDIKSGKITVSNVPKRVQ